VPPHEWKVAAEEFVAPREPLVYAVEAVVVDERPVPDPADESGRIDEWWAPVEREVPTPRLRQLKPVEDLERVEVPEPAGTAESPAPWCELPDGDRRQSEPEGIVSEHRPERQGPASHQKPTSQHEGASPQQKHASQLKRRSHLSHRKPVPEEPESASEQKPAPYGGDGDADAAEVVMGRVLGRHRSDVALADLLAEALVAYQDGRRSQLAESQDSLGDSQDSLGDSQDSLGDSQDSVSGSEDSAVGSEDSAAGTVPPVSVEPVTWETAEPEPAPRPVPELYRDDQPEPNPSVPRPTTAPDMPTGPIPLIEIASDSGEPVITRASLVELPPDQVWREPGTF